MKRFLIRLFGFFLFSFIIYIILVVLVGSSNQDRFKKNLKYPLRANGYLYTRIRQADTVKNVDVLVIGSSHAYRGYDPREFAKVGIKMFNLGSSAQTPLQTEALLKAYLGKIKPKMVIIDIYPVMLGLKGVESALDLLANSHANRYVTNMTFGINNPEVYNTMIYAYYRQLTGKDGHLTEPLVSGASTYINGGFVESKELFNPSTSNRKFEKYKFSDVQMVALKRISNFLKEQNIPYIFSQTPIPVKRYYGVSNRLSVDTVMQGLGTYYDFNKLMVMPDSCFADDSHLNQNGVLAFNKRLFEVMHNFKNN